MADRRILFVHQSPNAIGGSERTMLLEARGVAEHGWEPVLMHAESELKRDVSEAFADCIPLPAPERQRTPWATGSHVSRIVEAVWSARVDLAHVHLCPDPRTASALAATVPSVTTAHLPVCPNGARYHFARERACDRAVGPVCLTRGYLLDGCAHTGDDRPFSWLALARSLQRTRAALRALSDCAAVIAPSRWQRDRLVSDGLEAEKIVIIPPPIELPSVATVRTPQDPPVLLMVGRLFTFKGGHHLLRASVAASCAHHVWLAGDGPARPRLEAAADEMGIAHRVRFLGGLTGGALDRAYAAASVLVVPSLWPETFGMVGPEAMARGVPVIAYDQAGVGDWLDGGAHGTSVRPGGVGELAAAIDAVLLRPDASTDAVASAAGYVQGLLIPKHTEALLAVYERALSPAAAGRSAAPP